MKRVLSMLLVSALVLGLAACGEAPASSVPPASQTASAAASSAGQAVPAESSAPVPDEPVPGLYTEMQQLDLTDYGELPLYAEPDSGALPLIVLQPGFGPDAPYCIAQQDGWMQCVCGSYTGWVHDSVPAAETAAVPVPDFLTEEQQLLYVQAVSLFDAYSNSVAGQKGFADLSKSLEIQAEDDYFFGYPDQLYPTTAELEAALNSVFTPEYLAAEFLPYNASPYMMREDGGQLYLGSGDRGSWFADITGYALTEQTEEHILFDVLFHFGEAQDWTCSLPVELVNTPEGWRFAKMATGADDLHWMEAMGPDFDPWTALGIS